MLSPIPDYYMFYYQAPDYDEIGVMSQIGYLSDSDAVSFCCENSVDALPDGVEWVRYMHKGQIDLFVTCYRVPRVVSSAVVFGVPPQSKGMLAVGKLIQMEFFHV